MARVITFFIFTLMSMHHMVYLEQYLLNDVVLQIEKTKRQLQESKSESQPAATNEKGRSIEADNLSKSFGYFEVAKLKFL